MINLLTSSNITLDTPALTARLTATGTLVLHQTVIEADTRCSSQYQTAIGMARKVEARPCPNPSQSRNTGL